ncbi:MAG: efflux RND transporter permease subunit [Thermodesulfobacteriota bacterium]
MYQCLIRHPIAVVLGALLIILGGLASLRELPVDLFPSLDYPLINVITHYPAGTAEDMEQLVTRPVENAMLGLTDLRRVRSMSAPGFSQVTVEFIWGVDVLQARQLVYAGLAQVSGSLPQGARPELENIGTSLAMLSTYTLRGGEPVKLYNWARYELAPRLTALPGVARVNVMGGGKAAYRIDLSPLNLLRHRLSASDVAAAIRAQNVLDTGGYVEEHGRDLLIRTEGRIQTLETLRGIVVARGKEGRPVRLSDVADVYAGTEPQRYTVTTDRQPSVAFTIQKQPRASTLDVSRAVDKALASISLPGGVQLDKFYDQAGIIGLAYRNMRNNLLIGALLAVLSLFWVLGRNRSTFIIAVSFPMVVLGTFMLMGAAGVGINLMTLGALTVAIGLIDDDAVVVLENIDRHRLMGKTPYDATLDGTREIIAPDVAGTLTVLSAFAPLVLITGLAGRLFKPFGLTFGFMLALSLLFSLTLIPLAAARWLPAGRVAPRPTSGARWITRVGDWNHRLLVRLLRHRRLTLLGAVIMLSLGTGLLVFNPFRFLPLLDEGSLLVSYQLAPGTSLKESDRVGDRLEALALSLPGVEKVFRRTGSPQESLYIEGPDEGELTLRLAPGADPVEARAALERELARLPGIITRVNEPTTEKLDESFSGLPALFGITVYGNDLKALYGSSARVEEAARRVPGLANVVNNTKVPVDQAVVRIDRDACARLAVDARTVADTVRLAMQGETVTDVVVDQRPVALFLRYGSASRDSMEALRQVLVRTADGRAIPLMQLASIEQMSSYPFIEHQHGTRSLTMTAEINGNPFAVLDRLNRAIKGLGLPAGIQTGYTGEYQQLFITGTQALWALLAAVVLVYGVMAVQLGSLLDPAVVLTKLPMDLMGASLALAVTRQQLDITVLIGFITLVGVSMNNGIMLLTFTRKFRLQGMDAAQAVREAVTVRTRPMLLSNMTTLLALVPAALGIGAGPQLLQPLGIMLFGGLTAGTLLNLNLLPVIYVATERWRQGPAPEPAQEGRR